MLCCYNKNNLSLQVDRAASVMDDYEIKHWNAN